MVGTPKKSVGWKLANHSAARPASNRSTSRIRQPLASQVINPLASPCTWNSGSTARYRSPAVMRQQLTRFTVFARKLLCDSTAPFDRPVVPEV